MKKILALILVCVIAATALFGCGKTAFDEKKNPEGDPVAAIKSFKTMGDVIKRTEDSEYQLSLYDDKLVYAFKLDETFYRVVADLTPETAEALWALDILDDDYDQKYNELTYPLEITTYENLNLLIPEREELDKFIGKTGDDLLNAGWTTGNGYNLEDMTFYMYYGAFSYEVIFNGSFDLSNEDFIDNFDEEKEIKPLTVKSISLQGMGNATDLGEEAE